MKPLEAWSLISQQIEELNRLRKAYYPYSRGYSDREITAQVMAFEALRRMEEEGKNDSD